MGFKFKTGRPKPVMKVRELVSLLESSAKGPKKHVGVSFEIVDVVISDATWENLFLNLNSMNLC